MSSHKDNGLVSIRKYKYIYSLCVSVSAAFILMELRLIMFSSITIKALQEDNLWSK